MAISTIQPGRAQKGRTQKGRTLNGRTLNGRTLRAAVRVCGVVSAALLVLSTGGGALAQSDEGRIYVADVDGAIDQVMARFVSRTLDEAHDRDAKLVVLRIDTPGGLISSTRDIVADILASDVPVVSYVAPAGSRAASAGTFIAAAAGVAAMAPATNIGAASPVGAAGEELDETLQSKVKQDAAAFIRAIADQRGRNAEALEATVLTAAAYSAEEALDLNAIDLIAEDLDDLLIQLEGEAVPTASGDVIVRTAGKDVRELQPSFLERVLSFLSTPDVAFLLFSLGGLAIVVELWSPGLLGPGVIGIILLLLSFAGIGNLPFSWAGIALLVFAFVLFFVESQVPGFGIFGIAGIAALVLGGIMLVGFFGAPELPGAPSIRVSMWTLVGIGGGAGLIMLWFAREVRLSKRAPAYVSPVEAQALVGSTGTVTARLGPDGEVTVAGESWLVRLRSGTSAEVGTDVVVTAMDGLTLEVEPDGGRRNLSGVGEHETDPETDKERTGE